MKSIFTYRNNLIEDFSRFSQSFVTPKANDIATFLKDSKLKEEFWPEPLLQINPHYEDGETVSELVNSGILDPECEKIFRDKKADKPIRFYNHQAQAITRAWNHENYILTTGTGSGKSLSFFVPIVSRILKEKRSDETPRTRAIIIYPMNALANSQIEEINGFLSNDPNCNVSVGRYTGQETSEERRKLADNPPDILLTNYMMMELILTRYEDVDIKVIEHAKNLEFLVLDELHTYRGRQGADVALLIRRLRYRLNATDMICIGTSATMTSIGSDLDQKKAVAQTASIIFGTEFKPENVITETLKRLTKPTLDINLASILHERMTGDVACPHTSEELKEDPLAAWVELKLSLYQDSDASAYKRAKPQRISKIYSQLAKDADCSKEKAKEKLNELLEVASSIEPAFFPFKLHQFISGPSFLMTTLQPQGERTITVNEQLYTKDKDGENIRLFKTYFCRECGQEFIPVYFSGDVFTPRNLGEMPDDTNEENPEWGFLVPYSDDFDYDCDDISTLPASWRQTKRDQEEVVQDKRKFVPRPYHVNKNGLVEDGAPLYYFLPITVKFCPSCGIEMDDRTREKNKLAGLSGEGRSSATTIITINLLNQMFEDENSKKKILGFVDNRQDAALQSGNFNDFIDKAIIRGSCVAAMKTFGSQCSVQELCQRIFDVLGFSDACNIEASSELYLKPESPLPVRKRNEQVALKVLRYRILDETRQAWKYSNPTVFHLGLLKIGYRDFDMMMEDSNQISKYEILKSLPDYVRKRLMRTLLDEMVGQHCLSDEILHLNTLESDLKPQATKLLNPRWSFDEGERLFEGNRLTFESTGKQGTKGAYHYLSCSGNSRMGRILRKDEFWSQDSKFSGKNKTELTEIVRNVASELLSLAKYYELVDERTEENKKYYQVYSTALLIEKGNGIPKNKKWKNEYFQVLYETIGKQFVSRSNEIFSYVSAEHTAQVSSEEREILEKRFREEPGFTPLPVLYCSPTMELGIDISSLNTVYMRNVPPTPANYAQRSGRAGRSGQAALVVTYCASQSPHDQWYFKHSSDMVSGDVVTPSLDLSNKDLIDSHLMSIWFAAAKCRVDSSISEVIETENETYQIKDEIKQILTRPELKEEAYEGIKNLTDSIADYLTPEHAPWYHIGYEQIFVENAYYKFTASFNSWINLVKDTKKQMDDANKQQGRNLTHKQREIIKKIHNAASDQYGLLTHPPRNANSVSSDFYIFRYLAGQGILPGYNFPRLPIIAWVPRAKQAHEDSDEKVVSISRSRFLALSEFGPYSTIYHRGNSFQVYKVKLNASTSIENQNGQLALSTKSVVICSSCGFGLISNTGGIVAEDRCPNCGAILDKTNTIPGLYRIETVETKPVATITSNDEDRMRQGYDLQTFYSFDKVETCEITSNVLDQNNNIIATLRYIPNATIYKVNKGWKTRKNKADYGFFINPSTGVWKKKANDISYNDENEETEERAEDYRQKIVPYAEDRKNCLILQLNCTNMDDESIVPTLQSAFSRGISKVFQIENSELSVELLTNTANAKSILFYESSEGGAGVLSRIVSSSVYLRTICKQALEIMHYSFDSSKEILSLEDLEDKEVQCISGCYHCLLSYYNQPYHEKINRRNTNVLTILLALANGKHSKPKEQNTNASPFELFLKTKGIVITDLVKDKKVCGNEYVIPYYSNSCKVAFFISNPPVSLIEYLSQKGVQLITIGSTKNEWEENLQSIQKVIEGDGANV